MTTINLRIPATMETMKLYKTVVNNSQTIGAKKFADIPLELLAVGKYQRTDYYDKGKVSKLAEHFNKNLMDQRSLKSSLTDYLQLVNVIYQTAAGTAHRISRSQYYGVMQLLSNLKSFLH